MIRCGCLLLLCTCLLAAGVAGADEVDRQLAAIARTGPNSAGSAAARQARDQLARADVTVLPRLLAAMDTPNVVAANWCRSAYEEIIVRELARPQPKLPLPFLRDYVQDPARQGRARRLVLKLLEQLDPEFWPATLPELLDDSEFRGEAVALALAAGDLAKVSDEPDEARAAYQRAFDHAREAGQVTTAAAKLREAGGEADVIGHLGFVVDWQVVGPFDAPGYTGFSLVLPPEESLDLAAVYSGQNGAEIRWRPHHTDDTLGQVDLNQAAGPASGAAAYAYAEVESPQEQQVQLRASADDNLTVWLNGEKVLAREQWLNGSRLDRFSVPVTLAAGTNKLLVKGCQGPQHKDPAVPNNWTFQLRLCDETGVGVGLTTRPVAASGN